MSFATLLATFLEVIAGGDEYSRILFPRTGSFSHIQNDFKTNAKVRLGSKGARDTCRHHHQIAAIEEKFHLIEIIKTNMANTEEVIR